MNDGKHGRKSSNDEKSVDVILEDELYVAQITIKSIAQNGSPIQY